MVSCYEAGRDGFWIHRALTAMGIGNQVIDSASIEVSRRARRAKTDRLDALKLVRMLVRYWAGERQVWRMVHVPSAADEAARHGSRERTALVKEQTRIVNQIRGWLATWGATVPRRRTARWWTRVETWCGAALPRPLQERVARAEARRAVIADQIAALDAAQRARHRDGRDRLPGVAAGAAEGRGGGDGEHSARGRLSVARLSESPTSGRHLGLRADAASKRRRHARPGHQSRGHRAAASD